MMASKNIIPRPHPSSPIEKPHDATMSSRPAWRDWISLIPVDSKHAIAEEVKTQDVGTRLKRRYLHDPEEQAAKKAKRRIAEDNIAVSPLLRIPPELRLRIFEYALCGHTVHVEQLHWGNIDHYEKKGIRFGQGLWNEICHDQQSECAAYAAFRGAEMGKEGERTPFDAVVDGRDIGAGFHVDSWSARHEDCGREPQMHRFNIDTERWMARERLSLQCLRTSRFIYKEMRCLPYSGNEFLFRSPTAFQAFVMAIRTEQLRSLQSLSIPVAVGSAPFSEARSRLWSSTLWYHNLAGRIRHLKELRITVQLYFPRDAFLGQHGVRKPNFADCIEEICLSGERFVNQSTNWLQQFSRLCQESPNFRVVVCDDPLSMWGPVGKHKYCKDARIRQDQGWIRERNKSCLTVEQKQALAMEIEERLGAQAKKEG